MGTTMLWHKQCLLSKDTTIQTAWVPEGFAKKGKIIKLKIGEGTSNNGWEPQWEGGWFVHTVYKQRQCSKRIKEAEDNLRAYLGV